MTVAELLEHLQTYRPTAEVRFHASLSAEIITDAIREAVHGTIKIDVGINSFEIVTDDAGQTVFLSNEGA